MTVARLPKRRVKPAISLPAPNPLKPVAFPMGASQSTERHLVDFQFYAPRAGEVKVVIGLAGSVPRHLNLVDLGGGAWALRLLLSPGQYEYHFLVDGEWRPDPLAPDFLGHSGETNTRMLLE